METLKKQPISNEQLLYLVSHIAEPLINDVVIEDKELNVKYLRMRNSVFSLLADLAFAFDRKSRFAYEEQSGEGSVFTE